MGLLGRHTVIVKCPACQASTKVNAHPDKPSIRCPRCQAQVPMQYARKYHEKSTKESVTKPIPQEKPSLDYAPEVQELENPHRRSSSSKRSAKLYASGASEFSYPDHSVGFLRYSIIIAVAVALVSILGIIYFFWRESVNSRSQEYVNNVKESLDYHQRAITHIRKVLDPLEGSDAQRNFREAKGKIDFLASRRRHIKAPDAESVDGLKVMLHDLEKAEKDLAIAEEEVKKFATQPSTTPADKLTPPSVAANLGSSMANGPPLSPSQRQQQEAALKPTDQTTVLINIPGLQRGDWNDAFARRFAVLADNGDGQVTPKWAGDLLTLEVKPVVDPARYATKINFGKLLYYSRTDRIITIEFNPERVNNYKAQGDIITPIVIDLKQRDKMPKILSALSQLQNLKVDPGRQAEVAAVLETIAIDGKLDTTFRDIAIKLLPNWSGRESADLLIRLLDDKSESIRLSAIDALVETKSPQAAQALVKKWDKVEPERITKALIALGNDAEAIVLPYLINNNSVNIRTEVCRVLHEIGTTESLKPLLDVMNTKDQAPALVNAAREAMKQILERKSK